MEQYQNTQQNYNPGAQKKVSPYMNKTSYRSTSTLRQAIRPNQAHESSPENENYQTVQHDGIGKPHLRLEEDQSFELDGEQAEEDSKKILSPLPETKKINYWYDMPNPYAVKWTKKVLRDHYNIIVKHNKAKTQSGNKKNWVIRKIKQSKEQKLETETDYNLDQLLQAQQALTELNLRKQQFVEIQLDLLISTLYEPFTDSTRKQ